MFLFLFTLLINGPLSKLAAGGDEHGRSDRRVHDDAGELRLPSSGLMRGFPASLVVPFNEAGGDEQFMKLLESMNLPRWLFPSFKGAGPRQWATDPIVQGFVTRWTGQGPTALLGVDDSDPRVGGLHLCGVRRTALHDRDRAEAVV